MSTSMDKGSMVKAVFRFVRWVVILVGLGFVVVGWVNSISKYLQKKTSISKALREYETYRYPSITFCHDFRDRKDLVDILKAEGAKNKMLDDVNVTEIIDKISLNRSEIFKYFSHDPNGDHKVDLTERDEVWTESVPHHAFSGRCFTYNPPEDTYPGTKYGVNFALKAKELGHMSILVHDPGHFDFTLEEEMPSSAMIEMAEFRNDTVTLIVLSKKVLTRLDGANEFTCVEDEEYKFSKCYQSYLAKKAGCQGPWKYDPKIPQPICKNLSALSGIFQGEPNQQNYWPFYARTKRQSWSGCNVPCKETIFDVEYKYPIGDDEDKPESDAPWVAAIWFKRFRISHEAEYLVCDFTCLLGELGGNLGFFLGASILAAYDILTTFVLKHA